MGFIFESLALEILIGAIIILWFIHSNISNRYNFWAKRGVPFLKPIFPYGNVKDITEQRIALGPFHKKMYDNFKGSKYYGIYETKSPVLVVRDLELIKCIMTKDFNHFIDRPHLRRRKDDYMSNHLFLMEGDDWKHMRVKLTPTFTSGKMKLMSQLMEKCSEQLGQYLEPLAEKGESIVAKEVLARFTTDIIGSCAFGLDINSMSDPNSEFYLVGKMLTDHQQQFTYARLLVSWLPFLIHFANVSFIPEKVVTFITKVVKDTVQYRLENKIRRNDFIDLLIQINQNKNVDDGTKDTPGGTSHRSIANGTTPRQGLTLEEMSAQTFVFFVAGFETASSTMTFSLLELACHPDVQERLAQEVDTVLENNGGRITYQSLQEMTYMDQVIDETLRMYASIPILTRQCTDTYKIPNSDLILEKGSTVMIPIYAIHHDPEYYPDPYKFDPERFTPENVKARHPYAHIPFGEGPRMCIGMRFGKLETKMGIATIISRFQVHLAPETKVPVEIGVNTFITLPRYPVHLKLCRR